MSQESQPLWSSVVADPYPLYHQMRASSPVQYVEPPGMWVLTRYADVAWALRDPRLSADRFHLSQAELRSSALISSLAHMMLLRDPPAHTRLRALVSKAFTPRVIEGLRPRVGAVVDELLAAPLRRGSMDLIAEFATPMPLVVIAELLGIPVEDQQQLKLWSDDLIKMLDGSLALAAFPAAEKAAAELKLYLERVFAERRASPRDDLISALLAARDHEDRLDDEELFACCVLLLLAGHETTTNLVGNGTLALLRHPEQLELLRADAFWLRPAVEELLRFDSPVQLTSRVAAEDLEIDGHQVRAGQEVNLCLGAANRDPVQFRDPDRLDIRREDNPHLAFGHGLHFCLGAALARLEGQLAFAGLLARCPRLRLRGDEIRWREGVALRGLEALPVDL
jgi:pimeloyl-[acyl-carrier protein] synthase